MKKIILSAFLLASFLGSITISGQMELSKYDYITNGETNMYQGIPNISFPLLSLGVPTAGIDIGVSLSYTTESASAYNLISDVGKGWNLSPIGSVVRSKTREFDDFAIPTGTSNHEASSDTYYYNYPGGSGRFYIGMDTVSLELLCVHTSPSNDKIIITKDPVTPNRVKSFTIIDTKGNRYLFDKINVSKLHKWGPFDASRIETIHNTKFINSGFFLSKIYNVKNEEVANVEYLTTTQVIPDYGNNVPGTLQNQKIKRITVSGMGSIEYQYTDDYPSDPLSYQTNKDRYMMNKLVLKNTQNQIINQYAFDREQTSYLKKLINLDKDNAFVQKFAFEYKNEDYLGGYNTYIDNYGYPIYYEFCNIDTGELITPYHTNRNTVNYGTLQRIILPTGGITEYEFESHSIPFDPNTTCMEPKCYYDNYDFDKIYTVNFDTNVTNQYTVNLPAGYQNHLYVKYNYTLHPNQPGHPGIPYTIDYTINDDSGSPFSHSYEEIECPDIKTFTVNPGSLNVKFSGVKKGYGTVEIYAPKQQRRDSNEYGYGLRLKSMKNFNPGSTSPVSYTDYEYSTFTDPLLSSGNDVGVGDYIDFVDERKDTPPIGYNNIKVKNMIDGSYSKYYYTHSIPLDNNPMLGGSDRDMSGYLRSMGILQKKEDYSSSNQLLQKTEINSEFKTVPLSNITTSGTPVKKINISKQSSTTETYINGTAKKLVTTSESNFDDTYNNMTSSKETLADGTVVEKTLLYPSDKGIQKLITANMIDIPLETSTKRNGKLVGKAETKFDDASHLYPTSVLTYNMQTQTPVSATTLDIYDSKGNLVQATGKNGIPTTTVWGYYQTQPIAVISGASYAQISSLATVTAAITASNADRDDPSQEPQLLTALENLRKDPALQNYTVTATTYDPMIGVTNSISANGIRTVNVYDSANRLIKTTDAAGKTLQEYQYNYKH
ncbi:hypothetical protein GCM10023210_03850 [Chryseobacterium ginsengisoli]|uniref:Sugar-binding protein n=1 Tax=Chryseobacterium ginsengisoli TaxID=363853 RepID=A0ABP9LVE7_9FLAO